MIIIKIILEHYQEPLLLSDTCIYQSVKIIIQIIIKIFIIIIIKFKIKIIILSYLINRQHATVITWHGQIWGNFFPTFCCPKLLILFWEAPFLNVLVLYGRCKNSFRPPLPLSNGQALTPPGNIGKSAPTHLGKPLHPSPYRHYPYGNNTFQKGASLINHSQTHIKWKYGLLSVVRKKKKLYDEDNRNKDIVVIFLLCIIICIRNMFTISTDGNKQIAVIFSLSPPNLSPKNCIYGRSLRQSTK